MLFHYPIDEWSIYIMALFSFIVCFCMTFTLTRKKIKFQYNFLVAVSRVGLS